MIPFLHLIHLSNDDDTKRKSKFNRNKNVITKAPGNSILTDATDIQGNADSLSLSLSKVATSELAFTSSLTALNCEWVKGREKRDFGLIHTFVLERLIVNNSFFFFFLFNINKKHVKHPEKEEKIPNIRAWQLLNKIILFQSTPILRRRLMMIAGGKTMTMLFLIIEWEGFVVHRKQSMEIFFSLFLLPFQSLIYWFRTNFSLLPFAFNFPIQFIRSSSKDFTMKKKECLSRGERKIMSNVDGKIRSDGVMLIQPLSSSEGTIASTTSAQEVCYYYRWKANLSFTPFTHFRQIGYILCPRHTPSTIHEIINTMKIIFFAQLNRDNKRDGIKLD